jgi:threonine dehydrogenase-like Zn-dependent dehydrogenase
MMRAMVYTKPSTLELLDVDEPVTLEGEVIVEVEACGICGSELHGISKPGFRRPPLIMGHEFSGRDPKGRAVAVNPIVSCGECDLCVSGRNEVCRHRSVVGIHRPGAFAERVAVPERQLYELPESVAIETGALVEPLANGLHAWRLAAADPGARVGVLGAGTIGLATLLVARHFGAQVAITDLSTERLAFAERLGANATGPTLEGEFDVVIDAVGARVTRRASLEHLRPAGTAVWIGLNEPEPEFDALDLIRMEKRIVGSFAYSSQEFGDAVFLAAEVDLHWAASFDLGEGAEIFRELMEGRTDIVKALLRPAAVRA